MNSYIITQELHKSTVDEEETTWHLCFAALILLSGVDRHKKPVPHNVVSAHCGNARWQDQFTTSSAREGLLL